MPPKTDGELVAAAREGDLDAFGTLVHKYQKRIYRIALHLLRDADDAEDVTQEAFVHAFAALDRFAPVTTSAVIARVFHTSTIAALM